MDLSVWLSEAGLTDVELARRIGTVPSTVNRARRGIRNLSPELALAIERETGGQVRAETLSPRVALIRGGASPDSMAKNSAA